MFHSQEVPIWLVFVQAVELILLIIFTFFGVLASNAITKHKLFHWNLRLLINVMGISWFGLNFTRIISLIDQFFYPKAMLGEYILIVEFPHVIPEAGRTLCVALGMAAGIMMIFERMVASVFLESYQFKEHSFLVVLGLFLIMPFTCLMSYYTLNVDYGYIIALLGGTIGFFIFSAFMLVDKWNRRRLKLAVYQGFNYTLTQRFQLSENIRASEIIFKTVLCCCGGSMVVAGIFASYRFTETPTQIFILRAVFNMYSSCFAFSIIMLTMSRAHLWRQNFRQQIRQVFTFLGAARRSSIGPKKEGMIVVRNTDGLQLAFTQQEEGQLYFKQLASAWNAK